MQSRKKAQVTLFLTMAVLLVLAAYVTYTSIGPSNRKSAPLAMPAAQTQVIEPETMRLSMQGCYETLAKMAVLYFGLMGTYPEFNHPNTGPPSSLTILYDEGKKSINAAPEATLAQYVDSMMPLCADADGYRRSEIELTAGTPKTKVLLRDKDVMFQTEYPVTAHIKGQAVTTKNLATSVPVRLAYLLMVANTVLDNTQADPDYFNLTLMSSFDLNVTAGMIDKKTAGYRLADDKSRAAPDAPYEMLFAVRT